MKIIPKPWGQEELLEHNNAYMVKRLTMNRGHRCSLQSHVNKRETIYVLKGQLRIVQGKTVEDLRSKVYGPGDSITIAPGLIHRMEGVEDCVYLEASTPELDDVVRYSDDYQRA